MGGGGAGAPSSRTDRTVSPQRRTRHLGRTLPEVRAAHGKDGRGDATRPHDGGRHRLADRCSPGAARRTRRLPRRRTPAARPVPGGAAVPTGTGGRRAGRRGREGTGRRRVHTGARHPAAAPQRSPTSCPRDYAGSVEPSDVVVTAGCNQAFSLVADALAGPGDEVITPLPYYFNHDMWLRMRGVRPVYLEPDACLIPRAADAEALVTPRTRAIVLITPGNPSGVTIPPAEIAAFAALARRHDIALILDETYRSFRDTRSRTGETGPPVVRRHGLALDAGQPALVLQGPRHPRLPGRCCRRRAGAEPRGAQADGLRRDLLATGRAGGRARRADPGRGVAEGRGSPRSRSAGPGWARPWPPGRAGSRPSRLGGFFAWVRHPFTDRATSDVVRDLVRNHDTLVIPGTAFLPDDRRMLRVSAGADRRGRCRDARQAADRCRALTRGGQEA